VVDEQPKNTPLPDSGSLFFRVIWMAAPAAIWLGVASKSRAEAWTFDVHDLVILIGVAVGIGARAVDTLYFEGTTADGSPSTRAHVVRYAAILTLATAAAWVLVQSRVV
jgi:hypothetical protein